MTAVAAQMLVDEILPRIQSAVPRCVKKIGTEDDEELIADVTAMAAEGLESCEARGVPLYPSSIAYFAVQRAKTGRRSYGATRTDAMCPAAALDGVAAVVSMDETLPCGEDDGELNLHDMLAAPGEDPAVQAGRHIDWEELLETLTDRELAIVEATASGGKLDRLAAKYGVSPARITQLKHEIGRQVKTRWGAHAIADVTRAPLWMGSIHAVWQRAACHYERACVEA